MAAESKSRDECFIVGVIGNDTSEQRTHADWFIDGIVIPVFDRHFPNFDVIRADRMNTPGMITSQIIGKLLDSKLVIADMSFLNANAFYEIGIRHMTGLPIIHAHLESERIPFDVVSFLSMGYSVAKHQSVVAAQATLKTLVDNVLKDGYEVENPVTQARGRKKFDETASSADLVLRAQFNQLSDRLSHIEGRQAYASDFNSRAVAEALMRPSMSNIEKLGGHAETPFLRILISTTAKGSEKALAKFYNEQVRHYENESFLLNAEKGQNRLSLYIAPSTSGDILKSWQGAAMSLGLDLAVGASG